MAPEVLSDQGYDGKKADVWSCGVILYVLLAGFLPFDESTIVALFAKIQNADFTYPSWFSAEVRSLLDQMLVADPKTRISIGQIKTHPWFQANVDGEAADSHHEPAAPTAAQLESAFSAHDDNHNDLDLDDDGHDHTGPAKLNAFDLVSQCGGFMIDKMFSPEIFYTAPDDAAAGKTLSTNNSMYGSTAIKTKCYQFTASNIPAEDLTKAVYEALEGMKFTFEGQKDSSLKNGMIKANFLSAKGMVGMTAQVFIVTPALCLLEIRKGKGDILEWNNVFSELIEKKIGQMLNRPTNPDGDAKEYY